MVVLATILIVVGGICALMGQKIFSIILPIIGFILGLLVGFGGVQGVLGTGAVSIAIAIVMALIVGVIMAVLAFMFLDLAITILMALAGISAFTFLGVALGLGEQGFIIALLAITGAIVGIIVSSTRAFSAHFIIFVTAFLGIGYVMAGVLLLSGGLSLQELHDDGIIRSVIATVDQSFLWLIAWFGGALLASNVQAANLNKRIFDDQFVYKPEKTKS